MLFRTETCFWHRAHMPRTLWVGCNLGEDIAQSLVVHYFKGITNTRCAGTTPDISRAECFFTNKHPTNQCDDSTVVIHQRSGHRFNWSYCQNCSLRDKIQKSCFWASVSAVQMYLNILSSLSLRWLGGMLSEEFRCPPIPCHLHPEGGRAGC